LKSLPQAISLLDGQHLFALYPKTKRVNIVKITFTGNHCDFRDQESLSAALSTIDNFSYATGLKLYDKKTEALWIGSNVGKNKKLLQEKNNLKWPEKKAKVLSVWISTDPTVTLHVNLNYTKKHWKK